MGVSVAAVYGDGGTGDISEIDVNGRTHLSINCLLESNPPRRKSSLVSFTIWKSRSKSLAVRSLKRWRDAKQSLRTNSKSANSKSSVNLGWKFSRSSATSDAIRSIIFKWQQRPPGLSSLNGNRCHSFYHL